MTEIPAPKSSNRRGTIALVLSIVSLLLSLGSCGVAGFVMSVADMEPLTVQSEPSVASASEVEAAAHVRLPPGTVALSGVKSGGLETLVSAKFRIPRDALDAFVASGMFTAPVVPGLRAVTAQHNLGGGSLWDPEKAVSVSGIDEQQPAAGGTHRSVLFNLDSPDTITVYLYASRG